MILVTGAIGFIGRHVVQQLLSQGLPVRVLLPENYRRRLPWSDAELLPETVEGSILDEEALYRAVTGVHTIIHLANAQWWGRERNLERIELAGTRHLLSMARSARVGRIIYLSHLGASSASAYTLHRIKGQVEDVIRNSGLAYTILRSGIVFGEEDAFINHIAMMIVSNPLIYLMPGQGEIALHPIYIDDLVKCILLSLESLNAVDNLLEIGGMEHISFEDLLLTIMRVTGMYRLIIPVPPYLMRLVTSVYSFIFPRSLTTPQWLDILATNRTTRLGNVYNYFGFQPRRIEDTLLTYLPQRNHFLELLRHTFRRRPRSI
jgi:NADH dehydrogenase